MSASRCLALSLLLSLGAAAAEGPTPAQRKEAATHYQRGVSLSKEGNYPAALAEFRAAYQAAPSFEVLFNIGLCERRAFKYGQSLRTFGEYLRLGGDKVPADRRAAVAKEIEQVRSLTAPVAIIVEGEPAVITIDGEREGLTPLSEFAPLGPGKHLIRAEREGDVAEERSIEVVSGQAQAVQFSLRSLTRPVEVNLETRPPGAMVSIDQEPAARAPRTVKLKPGTHEVVAKLEGYTPTRTDVVVQPGQGRSVTVELAPVPPAVTTSRRFPVLGVTLISAGLISSGLGLYFAAQAGTTASQVTRFAQSGGVTWDAAWTKTERAGQQQQLAAQVLLGAGGALALSGLVATFLSAFSEPGAAPRAQFLVLPSSTGVSASCAVSF